MNPTTISRLLELNRQFYQSFATDFSATRQGLQPGVQHLLGQISQAESILDLGCGNGQLARQLSWQGYPGHYIGIDFSPFLLEDARKGSSQNYQFIQADIGSADWDASLKGHTFDTILAFAVLHHIPGIDLRQEILRAVRALLSVNGRFVHSEWQFLNSPRLTARVQPWNLLGISESEVDPGDYLLDWRRGGHGLRYVHHFSQAELAALAESTSFRVINSFLSDGENQRLGLYQVWS